MIKQPLTILNEVFGYSSFRPQQEEIIKNVIEKSSTLAIMPTSYGKSILYQIPALCVGGLNIVISPLISLMADQCKALQAKGIKAEYLNSTLNAREKEEILIRTRRRDIELLYVAPERFKQENFCKLMKALKVNIFAIDEVHSVSQAGDYRPSYRCLKKALKIVKPKRVIMTTATANKEVRDDILENLGLPNTNTFIGGFERDDLQLNCEHVSDSVGLTVEKALESYDVENGKGRGIIYTTTRKTAASLVSKLQKYNIPVYLYHGALTPKKKKEAQTDWFEKSGIMIATCSFGQGIDVPDVRWIINCGIPADMIEYYQMVGRGSRDGKGCVCNLYMNDQDKNTRRFLNDMSLPDKAFIYKALYYVKSLLGKSDEKTIKINQADVGSQIGLPPHIVGGVFSFLKNHDVVYSEKRGEYTFKRFSYIDMSEYDIRRENVQHRLSLLQDFIENGSQCRMKMICEHFESEFSEKCNKCDNCN